jgi:hypothetical protein
MPTRQGLAGLSRIDHQEREAENPRIARLTTGGKGNGVEPVSHDRPGNPRDSRDRGRYNSPGDRGHFWNGDQGMLIAHTAIVTMAICVALVGNCSAQSRKQPRAEAPKSQQGTQPDQRGTASQPLSVNIVPTAEQKADTEKKDREAAIKAADDHKLVDYAWYQFLVGVVTFFIFVLQLIAFSLQARYMRRTVIEMRRTTHATIRSARAAQKSAEGALRQANAMIAVESPIFAIAELKLVAFENEHSSFATVDPVLAGLPLPFCRILIRIENRGRTELTINRIFCDWIVAQTVSEMPEYHFEEIWNGALAKDGNAWFPSKNGIRLSQLDATAVENLEQFLWVYGKFIYTDFMGDRFEYGYIARWTLSHGFVRDPLANYEYKRKIQSSDASSSRPSPRP